MSLRICRVPRVRATALGVLLAASCLFASREARGQFVQQQVGGVSIDAHGVVSSVRIDALNELKRERQKALEPVTGDLKPLALRKISLRQLEAAIAEHRQNGTAIGDDIRFLAGLQRIQYVFVYPERNDVVLAGPAEGWKLNGQGELVGLTTNRPVMLLDDLLVALRSLKADRPTGISCSIDPTSEGIARLQTLLKNAPTLDGNPDPFLDNLEQTLGPQTITVAGVADTTHFANVLVAADYRMKRLAMAFEPAPIAGLPDFLHMLKSSSSRAGRQMLPRWWLAPAYDAILADADGLAWELGKAGVKAMTEEEVINAAGERKGTGHANPLAKKWADNMTSHYDELSAKDAVFGQLRNCMDLAVVSALISKERLAEKCGWSMALLMNPDLKVEMYNAAHQVDSQASAVQKGSSWIISASGGVQINPWQPLEKPTPSPKLGALRTKATAPTTNWWWN